MEKQYVCIDLKSFYASVECVERGLDPLKTNLLVADPSRTEKTICLALTPPLKAYGLSGRSRLFEVVSRVKEINAERRAHAPGGHFSGKSCDDALLKSTPSLALDYITAPPRMALYMEFSTKIYEIYLKYVSPDDIHVYSIDEVFIDLSPYLRRAKMSAREFTSRMIRDVYDSTGITATAGIGTNLYLAKIAMDIEAKRTPPDRFGVRIAELDERSYKEKLWSHRPLTDFWRVGHGYAAKLEKQGILTMGDIALCSLGDVNSYYNEDLLYSLFGVGAKFLIDHAWGYEPCTISDIKGYRPASKSIGSGQVLHTPYGFGAARLILKEMTDALSLELVDKGYLTSQMVLTVGYDADNVKNGSYTGEITVDRYGRKIPKHAHGTANLGCRTSSSKLMTDGILALYDKIVDPSLLVRRINVTACALAKEHEPDPGRHTCEQLDIFADPREIEKKERKTRAKFAREKSMQKAIIEIKKRYGKNAVLRGINFEEGATARAWNAQIGGHRA